MREYINRVTQRKCATFDDVVDTVNMWESRGVITVKSVCRDTMVVEYTVNDYHTDAWYDFISDIERVSVPYNMEPLFACGDSVRFTVDDNKILGKVYVVDRGVFEDPTSVYYDIMAGKCLFKHVHERFVEGI